MCDEAESLAVCSSRNYWEAFTREELPAELTRACRQEELNVMQDWHVWAVDFVAESLSVVGKARASGSEIRATSRGL